MAVTCCGKGTSQLDRGWCGKSDVLKEHDQAGETENIGPKFCKYKMNLDNLIGKHAVENP